MLEVKFFGKEQDVCLAAVKDKNKTVAVEAKGSAGDLLIMLITIINALNKKLPSGLIKATLDSAFDDKVRKIFDTGVTVDMTELMKQSGK